jgi:arylsulfatase A-like enzyme
VSARPSKKVPRSSPRRASRAPIALTLALVAASALGGCGGGGTAPPRWIDLASGFQPRSLEEIARSFGAGLAPEERPVVRLHEHGSVGLERSIPRTAWKRGEAPGSWWTPRPRNGGFEHVPDPDGHTTLVAGETAYRRIHGGIHGEGALVPGDFAVDAERITLVLGADQEPPESAVFGVSASSGAAFEGTWHVRRSECSGTGVPVWSGAPEEIVADVPPGSALRVTTSRWEPAVGYGGARGPRLRIRLDGVTLLEVEQDERWTHHRLLLPPEGREQARFVFELEGAGLGLFVAPTIGPAECGRSGERPWREDRPDLVLFLADTFRADNLAAWGGAQGVAPDQGVAPELDRAAARGLRFLQARSASSWTLPSISTLLTGIYPPQHGAVDKDLSLSRDLTTIAEVLRRAGYRTGAITDRAFFSQAYGLEQGFDWFVEFPNAEWNLDRTLDEALAFLGRDDGRPTFLVVHTYRTHMPYRQGPDEDPGPWDELYAEGRARFTAEKRSADLATKIYLSLVDRFRALYLGAVRDLDLGFGRFFRELEDRRTLENGYLVFTSDHGEAFGENGAVQHGADLFEAKLRVPLFVLGPGVEPGEDTQLASLVDLAPTFASLAGLAPDPSWPGLPLVPAGTRSPSPALREERATYAFELVKDLKQLAILERGRKVFAAPDAEGLAAGAVQRAFDLAADPGEERPLDADVLWPAELCREKAGEVRGLLVPRTGSGASAVPTTTPEQADDIRDLGYGGGEEDGETE